MVTAAAIVAGLAAWYAMIWQALLFYRRRRPDEDRQDTPSGRVWLWLISPLPILGFLILFIVAATFVEDSFEWLKRRRAFSDWE